MPEDATLDDFLGGDSEDEPSEDDNEPADGDADSDESTASDEVTPDDSPSEDTPVDTDGVKPAAVTYNREPGGAACEACGDVVTERWDADGAFVCADCKEW